MGARTGWSDVKCVVFINTSTRLSLCRLFGSSSRGGGGGDEEIRLELRAIYSLTFRALDEEEELGQEEGEPIDLSQLQPLLSHTISVDVPGDCSHSLSPFF